MSTGHAAVDAVVAHATRWNAMDRSAWLELFADDVTFEDPVGKAPKVGRTAAEGSWDNSFTPGRRWTLHPQRIIPGGTHEAGLRDGAFAAIRVSRSGTPDARAASARRRLAARS